MNTERGNILFLILLAVVLFAALSYAVTSSMRGGGNSGSAESVQAYAASIQSYVALVRNEVQRLRLTESCDYTNIDWRTNIYKTYAGNTVNSVGPSVPKTGCALFSDYGGRVAPQIFDKYKDSGIDAYGAGAPNTWLPGHMALRWVRRVNEGVTADDDIAILMTGITWEVCNILMGQPITATLPSTNSWIHSSGQAGDAPPPVIADNLTIGYDGKNLTGEYFYKNWNSFCLVGAMIWPR